MCRDSAGELGCFGESESLPEGTESLREGIIILRLLFERRLFQKGSGSFSMREGVRGGGSESVMGGASPAGAGILQ